jgi:hypothetical protein
MVTECSLPSLIKKVFYRPVVGKTSTAGHRWIAKQFWVDRQSFKQEDNKYCLAKVQINKLNVYLQFKLNYDVCYTYESCLYIFPITFKGPMTTLVVTESNRQWPNDD